MRLSRGDQETPRPLIRRLWLRLKLKKMMALLAVNIIITAVLGEK